MTPTKIDGFALPAAPGTSPASNSAPAFKIDIPRSLRMRPKLAIGVAGLVLVTILGYVFTRKPMYQSESLVYVEPLSAKILSDGSSGAYDPSRYESYMGQQILTAQRSDILTAAVASLPEGTWKFPGESTQAAAARLAGALKVTRVPSSYQLSISATGRDPKTIATVVNAVTKTYLEQGSKDEHTSADVKLQLLNDERQRIQTELEDSRKEQASLGASLGVANPVGETANTYDMQLAGIRSELTAAREAHDVAAAQLASMSTKTGDHTPGMVAAADDLVSGDAGLSGMKSTINQRRAILQSQMAGLTPSNPVYKQDQDEIAVVDRELDAMTARLQVKAEHKLDDKLRQDLQRTGDVEGRLNAQLAHETTLATSAAPKLQRAAEVEADIQRLQTRFAAVDDAIRGLQLESSGPGSAHLSLAATVPTAPESSRAKLLLMLALPLALLAGIAAAVIAQKRDPRVYTTRDVQESLGFLPMGVMPAANQVSDKVIEEYLLRLAAGLERAYRASEVRSFVFTAASPSTDISMFVHAVQRKLVDLGFSATVVEAEALLGTEASRMNHRAYRGQSVQGEIVQANDAPTGFAAAKLDRLKQQHDLLLIDARPLLHSAASEYAVRSTDATLLIIESGVTTAPELKQAAVLVSRLHAPGVGAVLQELHLEIGEPDFRAAISMLENEPVRTSVPSTPVVAAPVQRAPIEIAEPEVQAEEATVVDTVPEPETERAEKAATYDATAPLAHEEIVETRPVEPLETITLDGSAVAERVSELQVTVPEALAPVASMEPVAEVGHELEAPETAETVETFFNVSEQFFDGFHEPMISFFSEHDIPVEASLVAEACENTAVAVAPQVYELEDHKIFTENALPVQVVAEAAVENATAKLVSFVEPVMETPTTESLELATKQAVYEAPVIVFASAPEEAKVPRVPTSHLSMRHFEFRQGRIRREAAAAANIAVQATEPMISLRREESFVLLSELHRPSPIEDILAKSASASSKPVPVAALQFKDKAASRTSRVPRSWAALNRFERRFEASHGMDESEEDLAIAAYERMANERARQA